MYYIYLFIFPRDCVTIIITVGSNSNNSKYQINRARSSREQCDVVRRSNAICCCHWQQLIPAEAALRMYDRDINSRPTRPHRRSPITRTDVLLVVGP